MKPITRLMDVLSAYQQGPDAITEASLSRVMGLAQQAQGDGGSFAILTSWRAAKSREENEQDFKTLQQQIRAAGLGYRMLVGHWVECQDPTMPYHKCPPDKMVDTVEPSLFVWGIDNHLAKQLSVRFSQDAWIYTGPETQGKVALFFREGGMDVLGEWTPSTVTQAYSQMYRRKKNKIFKNLEASSTGGSPGFTFAMPAAAAQPGLAAESVESEALQFIELRPENHAESTLYARYTQQRDSLLESLTEAKGPAARDAVINFMTKNRKQVTTADVAAGTGLSSGVVLKHLNAMHDEGWEHPKGGTLCKSEGDAGNGKMGGQRSSGPSKFIWFCQ